MARSFLSRDRQAARRAPQRQAKRRVLVVCEGACTEPQYIEGFVRKTRTTTVEVVIPNERGDPKKLVEIAKDHHKKAKSEAKQLHDPWLAYDQVWCVFDRDQHERFDNAVQMARDLGFELAISNPCVELWLLLHFRDSPGARDRKELRRMLRDEHLPGYDKSIDFDLLWPGTGPASLRAERLSLAAHDRGDPPHGNPSTGFYRLTAAIAGAPAPSEPSR